VFAISRPPARHPSISEAVYDRGVRVQGGGCESVDDLPASRSSHVQSVDRAVALLRALAAVGGSASVASLAHRCGLNRATAWRLLTTLETQRMVVRDPRTALFHLGPTVLELQARTPRADLVELAHPVLERLSLETGETACLGVVRGDVVHYVAEVIPAFSHEESWLGQQVLLHASSMGKAFLAFIDEDRVDAIVGSAPTRFTDSTITEIGDLHAELAQARARGFAICRGEFETGSWGVAAPITDASGQAVAVLCLWGPDNRGDTARLDALGRLARRAAHELGAPTSPV
jgi:IclR family transcriptional regulator, acetate operon repressor